MRKSRFIAAVAVAITLTLTGCGGNEENSQTAAQFNDADVTFAQGMIPHHRQAVEMAQLAGTHSQDEEIQRLAAEIESAQDPEIKTMTGWLEAWGEDVPEHTSGGHGDMDMPGMMSAEDMKSLGGSSGAGFDRMFVQMMIKHHKGAIEMARTEQANGKNADAIALAKQIEKAQAAEIAVMRGLLGA
jgi:uncharacterized protein (DUF305 family)